MDLFIESNPEKARPFGAARKYLATIGSTLVTAGALITGSALNKTLGNLFLKIDLLPVPTRLSTNEEKAMLWLRQYLH